MSTVLVLAVVRSLLATVCLNVLMLQTTTSSGSFADAFSVAPSRQSLYQAPTSPTAGNIRFLAAVPGHPQSIREIPKEETESIITLKDQGQKLLTQTEIGVKKRRKAASRRTQLRRILQSVENVLLSSPDQSPPTHSGIGDRQRLLDALRQLVNAKTTQQVIQAGRQITQTIDNDDSKSNMSIEVLERVAKATAMTGLFHIALNITTTHLMIQQGHTPSTICQEAICQGLRKIGRVNQMQEFLIQIGQSLHESRRQQPSTSGTTSLFAYNVFLAALCDPIVDQKTDRSFWAPIDNAEYLRRAVHWLESHKTMGIQCPDSVAYATVLNAAAEAGNRTIANQVWNMALLQQQQQESQQQPFSIETQLINARLKSLQQDDDAAIQLYEEWIHNNDNENDNNENLDNSPSSSTAITSTTTLKRKVKPDRYTVDLLLLPLLRAGRIGDVEQILDHFLVSDYQAETVVADAFQSFLWTLVNKGNDVAAAKAIFDMYIGPALEPVIQHQNQQQTRTGTGSIIRLVRPRTRYFTILLEGYKRQLLSATEAAKAKSSSSSTEMDVDQPFSLSSQEDASTDDTGEETKIEQQHDAGKSTSATTTPMSAKNVAKLRREAWKLYNTMRNSPLSQVQPDEFTISVMMSICQSPSELTDLLEDVEEKVHFPITSAVLRSAITAYGSLGDPSSACALFAQNVPIELQQASSRYWNVLLGAMARASEVNGTATLDVVNAQVNRVLTQTSQERKKPLGSNTSQPLQVQLHGLNLLQAAKTIVMEHVRQPDSQTYALLAKVASSQEEDSNLALPIFRDATSAGIPADGRFINAVLRCFGADIDAAVEAWKGEIRSACLLHENRSRSKPVSPSRKKGKNLVAAYHGLIFVAGRAMRPDVALRLVYAMGKEGLVVDETALNCYQAGKRRAAKGDGTVGQSGVRQRLRQLLNMVEAYESLLYVECVKYDQRDKRRSGDKKIRIII